jgi:hypothetical protein
MLSPDNYVQAAGNTQSYNRYSYVWNNPLKYTDPSGDFIFTAAVLIAAPFTGGASLAFLPAAIGADIGMWQGGSMANGTMNPLKWDYSSGKTWGYMAGGAVVGAASGYVGGAVAASGGAMANTLGVATASYINSVGTAMYTGGQTDVSVSLGVASYNFDKNEWGYLGKPGNSAMENIGYGLGALANLRDVSLAFNSTSSQLITEGKGESGIPHSALQEKNGNNLMSWGPSGTDSPPSSKAGFAFKCRDATSNYAINPSEPQLPPVDLQLNKNIVGAISSLDKSLPYQGASINCSNMAGLALWANGIPNIGLHPYLLYATANAYSLGVRPDLFSYYFTQRK